MLSLTAILRVWPPQAFEPRELMADARCKLGHAGLTVIALVFVLMTVWQR